MAFNRSSSKAAIPSDPAFGNPARRVYPSATLGAGGKQERIFGRRKITRIPVPEGWELTKPRFDGTWVRLHDSGDFFSQDYLARWLDIIRAGTQTRFYCYTKMWLYFASSWRPTRPRTSGGWPSRRHHRRGALGQRRTASGGGTSRA